MTWHRFVPLVLLLFSLSCGSSPGEIAVTLDLDALTDTQEDQIQSFIFLTADPAGATGQKLIYPQACVRCSDGSDACDVGDLCLMTTDCGFQARGSGREDPFQAQIEFSMFPAGSDVSVIACGMDGSQVAVSSGNGTVENTAGEVVSVPLTVDAINTDCTGNFPAFCTTP